jgi:hypothetical protein
MLREDVPQELDRQPFVPIRLRLSSGKTIDIPYSGTAWVRQNTLLIVHRIAPHTSAIGNCDVIYLGLIERIESAPDGTVA